MDVKNIKAFGTEAAEAPLNQLNINRRSTTAHDVEIEILYCGVCHSDLHTARNEWHGTTYPCVPGHEIVGRIVRIGDHVSKHKVGDLAGVGCLVDSCRECEYCKESLEQYCERGNVQTYNSPDKYLGTQTYGGYSESIVVVFLKILIWLLRHLCFVQASLPIHRSGIGRQVLEKRLGS
jgi:uncharacterized zinc-type alcohol dehydrogenase-like protein